MHLVEISTKKNNLGFFRHLCKKQRLAGRSDGEILVEMAKKPWRLHRDQFVVFFDKISATKFGKDKFLEKNLGEHLNVEQIFGTRIF